MGCASGRYRDDALIQQNELSLQILLCTLSDIKNGFFYLNKGKYIQIPQIQFGFQSMHNSLSQSLVKQENIIKILDKFILPFKEDNTENYYYQDLLIAFFMNSRSNTVEKATSIAQLLFMEKDELNQGEIVDLFKTIFKAVMSYSFAVIDKFGKEQKQFDKPKSKEEQKELIENEPTLLLATGQNLAKIIGESMVEKDKTITVAEFAEKCKSYIPHRFYRDIFITKELRTMIYREYDNLNLVDRNIDENKSQEEQKK